MPLVGVHNSQPILHMYRIMVQYYSIYETINKFAIGYMIKNSLKCNKVFRIQVEKYLSISFSTRIMENIKDFLRKNNTCVMTIIMFYDNNG